MPVPPLEYWRNVFGNWFRTSHALLKNIDENAALKYNHVD